MANTKTVAIRLDEDVHAQLSIIAQLADTSLTEEIREAIEAHIDARRRSGDLATQADAVLEGIERDAATRRDAINSLFGTTEQPRKRQTRRKNTNSGNNDDTDPATS
ncbi:MAG: hypothetical protein DHS20C19_23660 [Acidimicrobiales bacterium]|nr:MAG: hypothetical protein DHS20C19_23660 [Acidimicrobiales bacterium]